MKVKTFFKRIHVLLYEAAHEENHISLISPDQARKAGVDLQLLFELFRPYLEDDMIVAIKDLEHK